MTRCPRAQTTSNIHFGCSFIILPWLLFSTETHEPDSNQADYSSRLALWKVWEWGFYFFTNRRRNLGVLTYILFTHVSTLFTIFYQIKSKFWTDSFMECVSFVAVYTRFSGSTSTYIHRFLPKLNAVYPRASAAAKFQFSAWSLPAEMPRQSTLNAKRRQLG
jgi:hypothetical protein